MSDLRELEAKLAGMGSQPVTAADLLRVTRLLHRVEEVGDRWGQLLRALDARLLIVDELPADAPFGALIRLRTGTVAQRATLYLGNGPDRPLTKLVPAQL